MTVDEALKYIISMGVVAPRPHSRVRDGQAPCARAGRGLRARTAKLMLFRPTPPPPSEGGVIDRETHRLLRPHRPPTTGPDGHRLRLGASAPRPWRRHLHRPARPRGAGAGGLRSRIGRRPSPAPRSCATNSSSRVTGLVRPRPEGTVNPNLATGEIEVLAHEIEILNPSLTPPFQLDDENLSETVRLEYRVLDLRRPPMQRNLLLRHRAAMAARRYLDAHGFIDIETPMLYKSTPEGARDFLVPVAHPSRAVLRAAAVAAALQAAADDRGLRPLLPDRQVLPRRGPARRSPAGVHADRHRDLVPRRSGDPRADGRAGAHDVQGSARRRAARSVPAS